MILFSGATEVIPGRQAALSLHCQRDTRVRRLQVVIRDLDFAGVFTPRRVAIGNGKIQCRHQLFEMRSDKGHGLD